MRHFLSFFQHCVRWGNTSCKMTHSFSLDFEFLTTNKDIKIQCCICFESISFFMHCEGIHDAPLSRFSVFEALRCSEHVHGFSLDSDLLRTTTHSVLRIKIPKIISVTWVIFLEITTGKILFGFWFLNFDISSLKLLGWWLCQILTLKSWRIVVIL